MYGHPPLLLFNVYLMPVRRDDLLGADAATGALLVTRRRKHQPQVSLPQIGSPGHIRDPWREREGKEIASRRNTLAHRCPQPCTQVHHCGDSAEFMHHIPG